MKEYLDTLRVEGEEGLSLEEYAEGFGEWALIEYQSNGHLPVPEIYNHSWLNLSELKDSLAFRNFSIAELSPAFRAVLAAMEELAQEYGAGKVRLIFGFGM